MGGNIGMNKSSMASLSISINFFAYKYQRLGFGNFFQKHFGFFGFTENKMGGGRGIFVWFAII